MRTLFSVILMTSILFLNSCIDPYSSWVELGDCSQRQCQDIAQALDLANELSTEAQKLLQNEWDSPPFRIEEAILAADYNIPFSCGQPYNDRISEQVLIDAYPGEILINEQLFINIDQETEALCALTASMVHAGYHLLIPDLEHECEVEVYCCEACPYDKTVDDPILAAERAMYLACLNDQA